VDHDVANSLWTEELKKPARKDLKEDEASDED
jgi:hypothetical protein